MENVIIKAENIKKSFKNSEKITLNVLKDINLEIEEKKISVIVGASGAGKSTLLHLLSCLDRADSGDIFYNNENILKYSDEKMAKFRNRNIGFVFQFHHLLPEFTALENVFIPLLINNTLGKKATARAEELLEIVGLRDRINHKPAELSGGEQQRVAVARALANDPLVIFADEPTGNLDSENSNIINNLFIDLKEKFNKTFVIVTHNNTLMQLADHVYEIKDGEIVIS